MNVKFTVKTVMLSALAASAIAATTVPAMASTCAAVTKTPVHHVIRKTTPAVREVRYIAPRPVYREPVAVVRPVIYERPIYERPIYERAVYSRPVYIHHVYARPIYEQRVVYHGYVRHDRRWDHRSW